MRYIAIQQPPVNHPAVDICSGSAFLCQVNYASVIATLISIVLTILLGFYVASRLDSRRPGRLQMVFELLTGYTRDQLRITVGQAPPAIAFPLALTLFLYILIANWIAFFPLPEPLAPANTDFNQTLAMGVVVFLAAEAYGI